MIPVQHIGDPCIMDCKKNPYILMACYHPGIAQQYKHTLTHDSSKGATSKAHLTDSCNSQLLLVSACFCHSLPLLLRHE